MLPDELPHRCSIAQSAYVPDDIAGDYDDPSAVAAQTSVACWVQPASKNTITEFQRRSQRVTHTVYFRGNPGIDVGHILTLADGPQVDCPWAGSTLEVKAVDETTAGLGLLWGATCELIQAR